MFVCSNCGNESMKWLGRCPDCGEWNSFKEVKSIESGRRSIKDLELIQTKSQKLSIKKIIRIITGVQEIDQVLGEGFAEGSVVLLGGDPGVGKSTLALQIASKLSCLYVSGEENLYQVGDRLRRLGGEKVDFLASNSLAQAIEQARSKKPQLLIIDSLQTLVDENTEGTAGSISQVKAITLKLLQLAKSEKITVLIIGHVTKQGVVAGPRTVEHMVDVVLYLEGERFGFYRILRSVKNRFGPVSEIGVFEMTKSGLIPVKNPSEIFLSFTPCSGSAQTCVLEGSRPIFATIEALVTKTFSPYPKRTAMGMDLNRLLLILAVIEQRLKLKFFSKDVFVKVSGGLKIKEPAGDLALAMALISSLKDKKIDPRIAFWGELALTGEIKEAIGHQMRLKEAKKLGFKKVIVPKTKKVFASRGLRIIPVGDLKQALTKIKI